MKSSDLTQIKKKKKQLQAHGLPSDTFIYRNIQDTPWASDTFIYKNIQDTPWPSDTFIYRNVQDTQWPSDTLSYRNIQIYWGHEILSQLKILRAIIGPYVQILLLNSA